MKARSAAAIPKLEAYLRAALNSAIEVAGTTAGLSAPAVVDVSVGWQDPFSLQRNTLLIIPGDQAKRDASRGLLVLPVALIAAIRGRTAREIADAQFVYIDAFVNVFEDDPTAGGAAQAARVELVEPYAPTPGGALIGLVVASATLDTELYLED